MRRTATQPIPKLFAGFPGMPPTRAIWTLPAFENHHRTIATFSGMEETESSSRFVCRNPKARRSSPTGWSVFPTSPSWTWPGQEGKPLTVEVYSGTETVRLYLNDKLIGEKPQAGISLQG